jgi:hypothetical protein
MLSLTRQMTLHADRILDSAAFQASPPGRPVHETIFYK